MKVICGVLLCVRPILIQRTSEMNRVNMRNRYYSVDASIPVVTDQLEDLDEEKKVLSVLLEFHS